MAGNIYKAINGVMSEIGSIGKDKRNPQQGFMYRGVDDVMNALQPLMIKHKVFTVPEVLEHKREERKSSRGNNLIYSIITVKYTFYSDDGSNVTATVIGEGMDSGDKASNKALSVAYKYACFQVFSIPTEEMQDPDADTPPPSTSQVKPPKQERPKMISRQQKETLINFCIEHWGQNEAPKRLADITGYASTSAIPATEYDRIMMALIDAASKAQ